MSCLREHYLCIDWTNFIFTAPGSLDNVVVVRGDPVIAKIEGLPLVYVESKNLDWTVSGDST